MNKEMNKEMPSHSKDVEDYMVNEEKLKNLGGRNIADMSDDEAEAFLAERKKLKADNEGLIGKAQEEATAENEMRDTYDRAHQENNELDAAKAKVEESVSLKAEADARAKQAEEDGTIRQKELDEAAALVEKIKGGNVGTEASDTPKMDDEESEKDLELVGENLGEKPIEEQIGTPKTDMFEKYGNRMREASSELVKVVEEMYVNDEKMQNKSLNMAERLKAQDANKSLNDRRNQLLDDTIWGSKNIKFRGQKAGETWSEYNDYRYETLKEYGRTAMQDSQIILNLAKAGQLGGGYGETDGFGRIDERFRSDPKFMTKILELLPSRKAAENFWVHCVGEARKNRELYIAAVRKNYLNYNWGPKEWTTDPEIQKIALESGQYKEFLQQN